jgi:hypothetical protein
MKGGMKPERIGRVVGIGVRVAGRMAGQRLATPGAQGGPQVDAKAQAGRGSAGNAQAIAQAGRAVAQTGGGVAKGIGGMLRPFRRVGGILWLEITGAFFLLPVVVFAPTMWRTRTNWEQGPDHRTFWAAAIVVVLFFYLGVSSFWRARRRARA